MQNTLVYIIVCILIWMRVSGVENESCICCVTGDY